jgi:hypothetical protein
MSYKVCIAKLQHQGFIKSNNDWCDREFDVIGAKKAGIKSIGVLYGYGDRSELENAGADYIVDTVADIEKVLIG